MSRNVFYVIFLVVALAISALLFREGFIMPTDADLATRLPEEILGFGYVSIWVFVAVFETPLLVLAWRWSKGSRNRRVAAAGAVLVFAIATAVGFVGYRRQMARVLGVPSVSVKKALFF